MTEQLELLPAHAHRALLYVERLDLVDVHPTADQVEMMAATEGPRAARYTSPMFAGFSVALSSLNLKSELVTPAEPVVGYLGRMGWLEPSRGAERVHLTDLGRALLVGLRMEAPGELRQRDHEVAIVLAPDDDIAYLELTGVFASAGAGLLVDPYFKADMLSWLISATPITRLLLDGQKGEVPKIEVALHALGKMPGADRVEVRASDSKAMHDRCLVHADRTVRLVGTSLTGVGKHLSTITQLPVAASKPFLKHIDQLWSKAEPVSGKPMRRETPGS